MLVPSKKIFYALEAVLYIAYNAKEVAIAGNDLCKAQNLPPRYLEPMLQKLVRAGVLRSVRGPQGGYVLGRERRRISLADIARLLTDEAAITKTNTALGTHILKPAVTQLMSDWHQQLEHITMHQLCEDATAATIATANPTHHDFTI